MPPHYLKNMSDWGPEQARIGLLEPICAQDSLALAWAKATEMARLGASADALLGELARVMEPHAVGRGTAASYEFADADEVTLRAMAAGMDARQARQLAQDVGLAAAAMARPTPASDGDARARVSRRIGKMGAVAWLDPLAAPAQTEAECSSVAAYPWAANAPGAEPASFACSRLRFKAQLA